MESFTNVVDADPSNTDAFYYRGIAYKALEEFDLAILDFNKVIELDPEHELAIEQLTEVQDLQNAI